MKLKLINSASIIGLIFIILQQIIVASSTALIAQLSKSVINKDKYIIWLVLFVFSLIIVYIPTTLTNYFIDKAKFIAYNKLISDFKLKVYNHPKLFYSSMIREKIKPYFTHEGWLIIQEVYGFFNDMLSTILSVIFNVIVLSIFLNKLFILSYAISFPLTLFCVLIFKPHLHKKSEQLQRYRSAMLQTLESGWDTILIGKLWNFTLWKRDFNKKIGFIF
ncbi:MAG: hypothetical protein LBB94_10235 [Clostridiales bacterium]|jgi:hypothetical protein|nr:hypothetical protein [Clostridiales bacterium]